MMQYAGENPPVNGIEHEKQDEIKKYTMFPSGIFNNETQNHKTDDFVKGVEKTRSFINEGVKLHSQVYDGKDAYRNVQASYDNIGFKSQTWIRQLSGDKGVQYPQHVGQWDERYGQEHGSPQAGCKIMQRKY